MRLLVLVAWLMGGCAYICPPCRCPEPPVPPKLTKLTRPELPKFQLGRMPDGTFVMTEESRQAVLESIAKLVELVERYEGLMDSYNKLVEEEAKRGTPQPK